VIKLVKGNGEFLFKTFNQALEFVKNPTYYEQTHGISIISIGVLIDFGSIKIVKRKTSDKRSGLFIFFKNSKEYDVWKFWCPSDEQMLFLEKIMPGVVRFIKKENGD